MPKNETFKPATQIKRKALIKLNKLENSLQHTPITRVCFAEFLHHNGAHSPKAGKKLTFFTLRFSLHSHAIVIPRNIDAIMCKLPFALKSDVDED